jgi:N6-adenosine-specific RNA methylase IME4
LVDLGLAEKTAAANARAKRWELIRQLPENLYVEFKQAIIEKNNDSVLTVAGAIAYVRKWKRERDLAEQRAAIAKGEFTVGAGPYDVIVCDPPWPYGTQYNSEGRRAANPYPEMSLEEIAADGDVEIAAKAAPDCILWLWTTHRFMRHSFPLLDRWGFADKQIVTWEKQKIGLGSWLRSKTEFCIMAVRGSPAIHLTNQSTIVHGAAREHSRKPDEFYELVESLCLGVRRYDRFTREPRAAWDGGGNQTEKFT